MCLLAASTLFLMVLSGAASAAATVEIRDAAGMQTVPVMPAKVVVYDPATLDNMQALGVQATAIADSPMPNFLHAYDDSKAYPRAGTLFEPDYEAVNALAPDLIIVAGRSQPKRESLARMAPTLDLTVRPGHLLEDVRRNVTVLGHIYQKEDQAQQLLHDLDAAIAAVRDRAKTAGTGLVLLTTGGKLSAYGPGSRFGIVHDLFGITPAADDLDTGMHGHSVSFEFIRKTNPDWLFVIDRDAAIGRAGESAQQLLDNALVHKTHAWQNDQVIYLDAKNWYLLGMAGLTSLEQALAAVTRAID